MSYICIKSNTMKKLITILLVVISISGYSQRYSKNYVPKKVDSVMISMVNKDILRIVNEYRKEKGLRPLKWDDRLKPAADHQIAYMDLSNTFDGHDQHIDIPDFDEIYYPWDRVTKLCEKDSNIYDETSEILLSSAWFIHNKEKGKPISYFASTIVEQYHNSPAHWAALMNPRHMFLYSDIDCFSTGGSFQPFKSIILLAEELKLRQRMTFDEKWDYNKNEEKFIGWTNKEVEDYYISKRSN